jgi:hypothetical protein
MLFFPIVNVECSNAEPPPFFGEDEQAQQTCATEFLNSLEEDLALTLNPTAKSIRIRRRIEWPRAVLTSALRKVQFLESPRESGPRLRMDITL